MNELKLEKLVQEIVIFIRKQLDMAGFNKLIIGLSGGLDSSVTAALSVEAIGAENVYGVMLPYRKSHPDSLAHALLVAEKFGIQHQTVDISPMVDAYFDKYEPDADLLRRGNRMARERMCVLYDLSAKYKALVAGTGNKSELLIGYCTQYGDSACAFEPIGHLYKTEVKEIAAYLSVPEEIINKNPTADLWEAQTDEAELGISYARLDIILAKLIDKNQSKEKLLQDGFSEEEVAKIIKMVKNSEFKRKMPSAIQ